MGKPEGERRTEFVSEKTAFGGSAVVATKGKAIRFWLLSASSGWPFRVDLSRFQQRAIGLGGVKKSSSPRGGSKVWSLRLNDRSGRSFRIKLEDLGRACARNERPRSMVQLLAHPSRH